MNLESRDKKNSEKNSVEAIQRYQSLLKNSVNIITIVDNKGNYIDASNSTADLLGIKKEDLIGKNFKEVVPEGAEDIMNTLSTINKTKEPVYKKEIYYVNNEERLYERVVFPIEEKDNEVVLFGSIANDITEKANYENKIRNERDYIYKIFNSMSQYVVVTGLDYKIQFMNEKAIKDFGDMKGKICFEQLGREIPCEECRLHEIEKIKDNESIKYVVNAFDKDLEINASKIENPDGSFSVVEVIDDITEKKKSKQKIIEMNERLENIIKGTNVGTWEWNLETGETIFDNKWAEMLGYTLEEISPVNIQTWEKLTHPDDFKRAGKELEKVMNKELEYYDFELRMKHKNGEWIWIHDRGRVTKWSEDGKALFMSGTHMDITDRKKAEEELIHSHNLIKYMLEHNTSGVAVHDKDMKYMYVSKSYLDRYKIKEKDIIGKHHYEIFPDLPQKWRDVHKRSLKGEVISKDEDPYYKEDGSVDWTKWETRPWYEKDGSIGGIIIYTEVITDQKKMEAQVYKEREIFKTTLLSVGDAVISTDKEGKIKIMNDVAEELTGWTQEEVFNEPLEKVLNIINEYTRKTCVNPAKKALKLGKTVEMENHTILIAKDGKEIPIEDSAAPIKDRDGNITGAVIVFRDFTEKKEKQNQIEYLSFHDHLTGLYNRRYMEDSIKRMDTERNLPFSIIVADVNGLKLTNDSYGHEMGDKLLIAVAEIFKKSCRQEDIVCRVGGDEFVILLPNVNEKKVKKIIERIKKESQNTKLDSVIVSLALGHSTKNKEDKDILEVYKEADNKMYKNKLKYGKIMRNRTIETILLNINNKYDHEQIHSERVSQYCTGIAKAMNLSSKEIEDAKIAGLLHDIGKIVVPPQILNKKDKLTENDWETIKKHVITSYQLLKSVDEYSHVSEAVLYHHERLDGTGYPEEIKDGEIPLLSKIIAVADAYEAMTADRPYHNKKTKEEAVEELKKYSGKQFDENLVNIFVDKVI